MELDANIADGSAGQAIEVGLGAVEIGGDIAGDGLAVGFESPVGQHLGLDGEAGGRAGAWAALAGAAAWASGGGAK